MVFHYFWWKINENSENSQKIVIWRPKSAQIGLEKKFRTIEKVNFLRSKKIFDPKKSIFSMVRKKNFRPIWALLALQITIFLVLCYFSLIFHRKLSNIIKTVYLEYFSSPKSIFTFSRYVSKTQFRDICQSLKGTFSKYIGFTVKKKIESQKNMFSVFFPPEKHFSDYRRLFSGRFCQENDPTSIFSKSRFFGILTPFRRYEKQYF